MQTAGHVEPTGWPAPAVVPEHVPVQGDSTAIATGAARRAALALASAALTARNGEAAAHCDDVVHLCEAIADELGIVGAERDQLLAAAQLHDVGKLAMPQEILDKRGPLDEGEWELMRQHTVIGERILRSVPEMAEVAMLIRHAHERWDGHGYPDGYAGARIPLASRVILCADAYHAIRSDRPYQASRTAAEAVVELRANAGTQFDPRVAAAMLRVADRARAGGWRRRGLSRRAIALLVALALGGTAFAASPPLRHAVESVAGIHHHGHAAVFVPGAAPDHGGLASCAQLALEGRPCAPLPAIVGPLVRRGTTTRSAVLTARPPSSSPARAGSTHGSASGRRGPARGYHVALPLVNG